MTYHETLPALAMTFLANALLLMAAPIATAILIANNF